MSDEQTDVLRQILELQKEQFAFAKEQRAGFAELQAKANRQIQKKLIVTLVLILLILVFFLTFLSAGFSSKVF